MVRGVENQPVEDSRTSAGWWWCWQEVVARQCFFSRWNGRECYTKIDGMDLEWLGWDLFCAASICSSPCFFILWKAFYFCGMLAGKRKHSFSLCACLMMLSDEHALHDYFSSFLIL